jgi:hypothetical protein
MSFVGKAVKKVFKVSKKIWSTAGKVARKAWGNKWVRIAAIVGLSVFTAGIATGGFAAFGAASAAAGGGVSGFFSAVGTTMATGWGSITASVGGLFGAAPAGTGGIIGGTGTTVVSGGAGPSVGAIGGLFGSSSLPSSAIGAGTTNPATAGGGILGFGKRLVSSIFSPTTGGAFMRSAIAGGIMSYAKAKEWDKERAYKDQATVYGGRAFGGKEELPEGFIKKPLAGNADPNKSVAQNLAINPADQPETSFNTNQQLLDTRNPNVRPGESRRNSTDISKLQGVAPLLQPQQGVA